MTDQSKWLGYFSDPYQDTPEHDPGRDGLCPVCMTRLGDGQITTTSLMRPGDARSYFYRMHKECGGNKEKILDIESSIIDGVH